MNYTQTFAIVGTLLITLFVAHSTQREQRDRESADLMLKFEQLLYSGRSAPVVKALEMDVELDKAKDVDDEAIDEFLGNYELLDAAYRHGLISADMADDAFEADLETALKDPKVRRFITDAKSQDGSDMYDGVLELARVWNPVQSAFVCESGRSRRCEITTFPKSLITSRFSPVLGPRQPDSLDALARRALSRD